MLICRNGVSMANVPGWSLLTTVLRRGSRVTVMCFAYKERGDQDHNIPKKNPGISMVIVCVRGHGRRTSVRMLIEEEPSSCASNWQGFGPINAEHIPKAESLGTWLGVFTWLTPSRYARLCVSTHMHSCLAGILQQPARTS